MKTFDLLCKIASDHTDPVENARAYAENGNSIDKDRYYYSLGRYSISSYIRDKVAGYGVIRRFIIKKLL